MRKSLLKRISTVLLAFAIVAAFMPAMSLTAYAGGGTDIDPAMTVTKPDGTVAAEGDLVSVGTRFEVTKTGLDTAYGGSFSSEYSAGRVTAFWKIKDLGPNPDPVKEIEAVFKGGKATYTAKMADTGKEISFHTHSVNNENSNYNNNTHAYIVRVDYITKTNIDSKTGSFTLTGHAGASPFSKVVIYNSKGKEIDYITSGVSGKNDFSLKLDSTKYEPGVYNMAGVLDDKTKIDLSINEAGTTHYYKTFFTSEITSKPTIKRNSNFFSTGYDFVNFCPYFTVDKSNGKIWLQLYDTKTKKWGDKYGPYDSYEKLCTEYFTGDKKSGGTKIKPNRRYKARIQYCKKVTYNGYSYYMNGPWSNVVTIKTGKSSKPSIKSVTIKATNVKKTKLITKAHWDVYGKWVPYSEDYVWTTTIKVTVKLRKKPGTTGLMIGDKKIKGNKKVYTATFKQSGKLKGKNFTVGICTYNDSKLGGYGKPVKKKAKVQ